jgi:hypothetical protein
MDSGMEYGLDHYGLRFGFGFGLMRSSMTTISNNKFLRGLVSFPAQEGKGLGTLKHNYLILGLVHHHVTAGAPIVIPMLSMHNDGIAIIKLDTSLFSLIPSEARFPPWPWSDCTCMASPKNFP